MKVGVGMVNGYHIDKPDKILFGACYYPEHWPEERWPYDAKLMQEAHVNIVRMAEFSWARLEPSDGEFDFSWLDKAIQIMEEHGICSMLGTPTAGLPKWLLDKHPDIYQRDYYGRIKGFGTRRHYCYDNLNFQYYTKRIVTKMAEHYKDNPNVIAWQIDNEFGVADTTRCYNDETLYNFREWLRDRYQTIDALNTAWGTVFSSQTYLNWEQIHLPMYSTHQMHNPCLRLDFYRYCSEAVRRYQKIQVDVIRSIAPHQPISTNEMGIFKEIDYYDLSKDLDFTSLDIYPNQESNITTYHSALQFDITRGSKQKNFWVTELQSGTPGGDVLRRTPKPGEMRRWTYQALAHGADALIYFRWRTLTFALEELWHGILQHHGGPGRKYDEVKRTGEELFRIGNLLAGSTNKPKVAFIRCYDNEWVFDIQPQMPKYTYMEHFEKYYRYFHERCIEVDILSPNADISGYRLVVIPNFMMSEETVQEKIYDYVRSGGSVVMDFRAGSKEWDNRMLEQKLPGPFTELLGVEVEDYGVILEEDGGQYLRYSEDRKHRTGFAVPYENLDKDFKAGRWYDVIELNEARPIMEYVNDYYAGSPAVTRNEYGKGKAYYLGTEPDTETLRVLFDGICEECDIKQPFPKIDSGIEIVTKMKDDRKFILVINHNPHEAGVELDNSYTEMLSNRLMQGYVKLQANDVYVLAEHN